MFSSHLPLLKVYILLYVLSKHAIFHIIITQTVPAAVPVSTVDSEQHAIQLTSYTQSHTQGLLELVFVSCVLNCVFSSHLPLLKVNYSTCLANMQYSTLRLKHQSQLCPCVVVGFVAM